MFAVPISDFSDSRKKVVLDPSSYQPDKNNSDDGFEREKSRKKRGGGERDQTESSSRVTIYQRAPVCFLHSYDSFLDRRTAAAAAAASVTRASVSQFPVAMIKQIDNVRSLIKTATAERRLWLPENLINRPDGSARRVTL